MGDMTTFQSSVRISSLTRKWLIRPQHGSFGRNHYTLWTTIPSSNGAWAMGRRHNKQKLHTQNMAESLFPSFCSSMLSSNFRSISSNSMSGYNMRVRPRSKIHSKRPHQDETRTASARLLINWLLHETFSFASHNNGCGWLTMESLPGGDFKYGPYFSWRVVR
jgi:hypothetical protein